MRLERNNGDFLELRIVGYQFPQIPNDKWDSNWLIVSGMARKNGVAWKFREPCLLTWEANSLAGWMAELANGTCSEPLLEFIEPNLKFERVELGETTELLRVHFELESALNSFEENGSDQWLDFEIDSASLRSASASLRDQLLAFPERATGRV